jgi:hypothetical protein
MSANESFSQNTLSARRSRSARLPKLSEKALIAAIAIAFLLLHILAGTILLRAGGSDTIVPQQEAAPSLYD